MVRVVVGRGRLVDGKGGGGEGRLGDSKGGGGEGAPSRW
jgi:hypothetical protein